MTATTCDLIPFGDAATRLGLTVRGAYKLRARDAFPVRVIQIGGRLKVRTVDLERFLAGDGQREAS